MKEKELQNELASIRNLMERSSKFISLSGLSGILAGVYALVGAGVVYYFHRPSYTIDDQVGSVWVNVSSTYVLQLTLIAAIILIASITTALFLSIRQAKRKGQPIWGTASRSLLFHVAVPLVTGGILTLIFLFRGYYSVVSPACLIFYGLALVSAANFTFGEVKYLGLLEIALGLICACLPGYGLLFWALGFGVLHIIYGSMMYFKYDK